MKTNSVQYAVELVARQGLDGAFAIAQNSYGCAKKGLLLPLADSFTNPVERNNRSSDERASKKLLAFWDHVFSIIHKRKYPNEKRTSE